MKMYTASLQHLTKLRKAYPDYLFVSIARGKNCNAQCDVSYTKLAPTWELLKAYNNGTVTWEHYEMNYNNYLAGLSPHTVFAELKTIALNTNKKAIVLVCYEKHNTHCHRRLVAEWYNKLGCNVKELNY